jgi:hypothetical protein
MTEYQLFLSLFNNPNSQQSRLKKLSISNLIKLIDDLYNFRHLENLQEENNKPFFLTVGDFMINKYKQKKMLEQFVMDFLITLEYFRKQVAEVALFHDFFIEKTYDSSDLTFYLFMRTQAEKEIGV